MLAEQGRYYDAVQQYQRALDLDRSNALAISAWARRFSTRETTPPPRSPSGTASEAVTDLTTKWTEVWSHIYLGRIFDIQGDRVRAVNEYSKAKQTGDDTGGAQAEAEKSLKKPYTETGA